MYTSASATPRPNKTRTGLSCVLCHFRRQINSTTTFKNWRFLRPSTYLINFLLHCIASNCHQKCWCWIGRTMYCSALVDDLKNRRNLLIKGFWARRQKESDKKKLELPAGNWNKTQTPVSWFRFYPAIIKEVSVPGHSHQDRVICAFIKQWQELLAYDIKLIFWRFLLLNASNSSLTNCI